MNEDLTARIDVYAKENCAWGDLAYLIRCGYRYGNVPEPSHLNCLAYIMAMKLEEQKAEIETLNTINAQLRDHNESLDAECARLEVLVDNDLDAGELAARFLGWKLPEDFFPDYGISFTRNEWHDRHGMPTGTNLLHFGQAKAMFEYVLAATEPKEVTA